MWGDSVDVEAGSDRRLIGVGCMMPTIGGDEARMGLDYPWSAR